jgi:DNA repair protein RadA/Sms
MKEKFQYYCNACGHTSSKWLGRCPSCNAWNSFTEESYIEEEKAENRYVSLDKAHTKPKLLDGIEINKVERWMTTIDEFDQLLGGGIMPGSLSLIGGDPGIGKSTLMLQLAALMAHQQKRILYISGEESEEQIKYRAERMGLKSEHIYLYNETCLELICHEVLELKPDMLIIDSIQTVYSNKLESAPSTVSQIKWAAGQLLLVAKKLHIPIFLIGHITKEGFIAGPKLLEHIVDTVLYFEGDKFQLYRILRVVKNRFGPVNEVCIFEMTSMGLTVIKNPSEVFLSGRVDQNPGSVILPCIEGSRAFLLEIQALVTPSYYGNSRRMAIGVDLNRLHMLVAVLEKKMDYRLGTQDIYVNVVGGITIMDPAADLAIAIAIISSYINKPIPEHAVLFGEVGLTGEIRGVQLAESRIKEAHNLGYTICVLPIINKNTITIQLPISLIGINNVKGGIDHFWN